MCGTHTVLSMILSHRSSKFLFTNAVHCWINTTNDNKCPPYTCTCINKHISTSVSTGLGILQAFSRPALMSAWNQRQTKSVNTNYIIIVMYNYNDQHEVSCPNKCSTCVCTVYTMYSTCQIKVNVAFYETTVQRNDSMH